MRDKSKRFKNEQQLDLLGLETPQYENSFGNAQGRYDPLIQYPDASDDLKPRLPTSGNEFIKKQLICDSKLDRTCVSELVTNIPHDTEEVVTRINSTPNTTVTLKLKLSERLGHADKTFLIFLLDYANKRSGEFTDYGKPCVSIQGQEEFARLLASSRKTEIVHTRDGGRLIIDDTNPSRVNFSIAFGLPDVKRSNLNLRTNDQLSRQIERLSNIEYRVTISNPSQGIETEFKSKLVRDTMTQRQKKTNSYTGGRGRPEFIVNLHPALLLNSVFSGRWLDSNLFDGFSRVMFFEKKQLLSTSSCSASIHLIRICRGHKGKAKYIGYDKGAQDTAPKAKPVLFSTREFFRDYSEARSHDPEVFKSQNRTITELMNRWIKQGLIKGFTKKTIRKTQRTPGDCEWSITPTDYLIEQFRDSYFLEKRAEYSDMAGQMIRYYGVEDRLSKDCIDKIDEILISKQFSIQDIETALEALNVALSEETGISEFRLK